MTSHKRRAVEQWEQWEQGELFAQMLGKEVVRA